MALASSLFAPGEALALVVSVNGQSYDISTFTGTYNANTTKFDPAYMPWYLDQALAGQFRDALQASGGLGYPNGGNTCAACASGPLSPFFGYGTSGLFGGVVIYQASQATGNPAGQQIVLANQSYTYAYVAPPVPAPAPLPILGAAAAFGVSRRLRSRIRSVRS